MNRRTLSSPLPRVPGTVLHRQLFIVLRDQITRGLYVPGAAIPKEDELCELFGVSRITVRRAVADLERLGLLRKVQGRGTFVTGATQTVRPAPTLSFLESLSKQSQDTSATVLRVEVATAPGAIALPLGLAPGEAAVHVVRLHSAKRFPLVVTDAWVPEKFGKHITKAELKKRPLFRILLDEGPRLVRVAQEITAVAADPYLADLLRTDAGVPLLRVTRLLYDDKERAVEHMTVYVSPQRSRVLMDTRATAINTLRAGHITHDVLV